MSDKRPWPDTQIPADQQIWFESQQIEAIKYLISSGSDVNIDTGNGSALHIAAYIGHVGAIEALISAGANVNLKDKSGITPLLNAIYKGHIEAAKFLIEKGARYKNEQTPLGVSYESVANSDAMKELLKNA